MRTVFIAIALASSALTACSLYFDDHPTQKQHAPGSTSSDAGTHPDDSGCCDPPDAGLGGCDDAGTPSDADWSPDAGIDDAPWPNQPDAGWTPDAGVDDAALPPDAS